jgi:hypothetical protein
MSDEIKYTTKDATLLNRQIGPRIDTGYQVNGNNVSANDKTNWSIQLVKPNKKYLNLWADEISIDFSMSGTMGQSRYRRDFYPHSFNEPTMMISGVMPNQREYNKLAAFVRESHSEALNVQQNYGELSKNTKPFPTVSLIMKSSNPQKRGQPRTQKGGRRGMKLEGYIKTIAAGAVKFNFAPAYQIEFIVAASDGAVGIYEDKLSAGSAIVDWATLFKEDHFGARSGNQIKKDIGQDTPVATTERKAEQDVINTVTSAVNNATKIFNLDLP